MSADPATMAATGEAPGARESAAGTTALAAPSVTTLCLDARVGIADATALHERLREAADAGGDLRLDAASVVSVDTAVLQLLVTHLRALRSAGHEPCWVGVSEAFRSSARRLDLDRHLGLPS